MVKTKEEAEANAFAERTLIPSTYAQEFMRLRADGREVIRFAHNVGVSPGIVVGQLQHSKRIGQNQLNSLKRRFSWVEP
jgi:Zn-dependent peptidase ImmA (M78 family)